jgi:hypothetical protein
VPLRPDPAYPEYPSGYNGFAAAVSRALENLFHFHTRRLQLTLTSTGVPGVQRHYHSGGAPRPGERGVRLADWTLDHHFQPLHGHGRTGWSWRRE